MRLFYTLIIALTVSGSTSAQTLKQVLFSTGGSYQNPGNRVKLYSLNPSTHQATVIDSIYGDFSNDLTVDSGFAYLHVGRASGSSAGEDMIVKYNLNTGLKVDSITQIPGAQKITATPNHIVVTFGYGSSGGSVRMYDKQTLTQTFSDTNLPEFTVASAFMNDTVYVAFDRIDKGAVAIYSMTPTITFNRVQMFDTLSYGMNGITTKDGKVALTSEVFNFVNFTVDHGAITKYNPLQNTYQSVETEMSHGLMTVHNDSLFADFGTTNAYLGSTLAPAAFDINVAYSDGAFDSIGRKFYMQETDYWSFGRLIIADRNGNAADTIMTDISGSAIALDYMGNPVSIQKHISSSFTVYPNPATDYITIDSYGSQFEIVDACGRIVKRGQIDHGGIISVTSLSEGIYSILVRTSGEIKSARFIRN